MNHNLLQLLSLPFGAELNLNIPEQTLEKVIQDYTKGKVAISEFHCMDGYLSFKVGIGIIFHANIQISIDEVILNPTQCIVTIGDKKGNLSSLVSKLDKVPFLHLPITMRGDKQFKLDLSHQGLLQIKNLPESILSLIDRLKVEVVIIPRKLVLKLGMAQD